MTTTAHVTLCVCVLAACGARTRNPEREAPVSLSSLAPRLDVIARDAANRFELPGIAIAIARGDEVVTRTYGVGDLDRHTPLSPQSVSPLGSITKVVKAAVALRLVEQGRLDLDAPLSTLASDLPSDITVRQLLHQTSGLPQNLPDDIDGLDAIAKAIRDTPRAFEPGTRWAYNNLNYDLLGLLLERSAHASLDKLVVQRMMLPLGLHHLGPCEVVVPTVKGYRLDGERRIEVHDTYGECGSAPDLARWGVLLARGKVLRPASVTLMTSPASVRGHDVPYGFGLDLRPYRGHRRFWHTGHLEGHVAALGIYPDDDVAVAVLVDAGDFPFPESIELAVTRVVLGIEAPPPADRPVPPALAARIVGTYDAGDILCRIARTANGVAMELLPGPDQKPYLNTPLLYQGDGLFVSRDAPESVAATFDLARPQISAASCDMVGIHWEGTRR